MHGTVLIRKKWIVPASSCQSLDKEKQIAKIKSRAASRLCTWNKYISASTKVHYAVLALISRGHFIKHDRELQPVEEGRNARVFSNYLVKQMIHPS